MTQDTETEYYTPETGLVAGQTAVGEINQPQPTTETADPFADLAPSPELSADSQFMAAQAPATPEAPQPADPEANTVAMDDFVRTANARGLDLTSDPSEATPLAPEASPATAVEQSESEVIGENDAKIEAVETELQNITERAAAAFREIDEAIKAIKENDLLESESFKNFEKRHLAAREENRAKIKNLESSKQRIGTLLGSESEAA